MPTEFRRIVFTNAELRAALDGHRGEGIPALPGGTVLAVRFGDETRDRLVVSIGEGGLPSRQEADVPTNAVAAALMKYCIAQRIPMPRRAQKAIVISGDNLALDLRSAAKGVDP
jgi:hypothetical protein